MSLLRKLWPGERAVPGLLFFFVSSVYFMTVTGVTSSNDGSQYAGARALADTGRFDIAPYLSFTEELDFAIDQYGVVQTDRPPGTSITASVLYRVGTLIPEPFVQVPSKHDGNNPYVIYGVLASVLAGAGTVILFYSLLRERFGVSGAAATLASLSLAFGTTLWKYGSVLYSHGPAALSVMAILYFILRAEQRGAFTWRNALLLGISLGASFLFEYSNAVLIVIALVYMALTWGRTFLADVRAPEGRKHWMTTLGALALGALPALVFIVGFNIAHFGGPLELSAYYVDPVRWACCVTLAANFQNPILEGLQGFLFYGLDGNQGLFLLMPVSILALAGWKALFAHSRRDFVFILGTFAVFLVMFSVNPTANPGNNDSRYLVPVLGLWFVPFGLWLDRTYFRIEGEIQRVLVSLLVFGLLFVSVRNIAALIALSWGYDLNLAILENRSVPPYNLRIIGQTLFPNARNLPMLWLLEAAALVIGLGYVAARRRLQPGLRPVLAAALATVIAGYAAYPVLGALRNPQPPDMTAVSTRMTDNLQLVGYQLSEWDEQPEPGDAVRVRLYWQLDAPQDDALDVGLSLVDAEGETLSDTRTPLGLATFREIPVTTWPAGRIIQEEYALPLASPPPFGLATDVVVRVDDVETTLFSVYPVTMAIAEPPAQTVAYDFDGLAHLSGYDAQPLPHHRLAVSLHWEVAGETDVAYKTFVHIVAPDGSIAAQSDRQAFDDRFATNVWEPGSRLVDTHVIQLGRAFRPGTYRLLTGMYDPDDGVRLDVTDAGGNAVFDAAAMLGEVALR